jgi:hypothetical protein
MPAHILANYNLISLLPTNVYKHSTFHSITFPHLIKAMVDHTRILEGKVAPLLN